MITNLHFAAIFFTVIGNIIVEAEGTIGINWGRQNAQRLVPSMVVDVLLQNQVPAARVYSTQEDVLEAFAWSGINLTVTIFDITKVSNENDSQAWVQNRIHWLDDASIRHVYLGNHAFIKGINNSTIQTMAVEAVRNLQAALDDAGHGDIKVTLPSPIQILKGNITKPSEAELKDSIRDEFGRFLKLLQESGAHLAIELFPIDIMLWLGIDDPSFAYADGRSTHVVTDVHGAVYTNVFEFAHDAFAWAIEKAGAPDVEIVVSHIGWPTDGYSSASVANAERFYKTLLPLVTSGRGTPKRPGKPIKIFVHALTDENKNPDTIPYGRHWGIYRSNGEPKYRIDLTGQGRDIFPVNARGIMRMPQRWCMLDHEKAAGDRTKVQVQYEKACGPKGGDCTSLAPGGSCSSLDDMEKVSYAFNMNFQSHFQDEGQCWYEGLGKVVTEDPSRGTCVFPVEVVKGQQDNFKN
ncbi:O-Glycosyl hydrolases family 17 protein [Striga hermonthica]|uniref:O-Glycosyl hydrolases family 17 protein n=1 Tax=Striga hermonthica TaxID=68872 RepID=A0A9N7R587_STRHE|nr:O-Glycosyl hydrolases family 17 protein [Striga hermonthica]